MLAGVLINIVSEFWPLMLGAVVTATILGAAIGRKTSGDMWQGAGLGALCSAASTVLVPLIVAILALLS